MDASRRNTIYGNNVYREITLPSASHRFKANKQSTGSDNNTDERLDTCLHLPLHVK